MINLNELKYNKLIDEYKKSIFYSGLNNDYYILHTDYINAYLKLSENKTIKSSFDSIHIQINEEKPNKKIVLYLPFCWNNIPIVLWK